MNYKTKESVNMATYKIEPISGDDYKLELSDLDVTGSKNIHLKEIPGYIRALSALGFKAEKIEWHCCEN